jgi:pyruvate,orthophosphate dikinase
MARGPGKGMSGAGVIQFVNSDTGAPQVTGRYLPQGQGRAALSRSEAMFIETDERGPALEDDAPDQVAALRAYGDTVRTRLREEMQIEFTLMDGSFRCSTPCAYPGPPAPMSPSPSAWPRTA